MNWLK
jgi:hypothetical protein